MKLKNECMLDKNIKFYCFYESKDTVYCINKKECKLFIKNLSLNTAKIIDLKHRFIKIIFDDCKNIFVAITTDTMFFLDLNFNIITCFKLKTNDEPIKLKDICLNKGIFYILSNNKIYKFNCNGDFLGFFMSPPPDTIYNNISSYNDFIFVAYTRSNCRFIASYSIEGVFLEPLILGPDLYILDIKVVTHNYVPVLKIHAVKCSGNPCILEIEFNERKKNPESKKKHKTSQIQKHNNNFFIELDSGENLNTTCFIED